MGSGELKGMGVARGAARLMPAKDIRDGAARHAKTRAAGAGGRSYTPTISPSYTLCVWMSRAIRKKMRAAAAGKNRAWRKRLTSQQAPVTIINRLALVMLASFFALIVGAGAATAGSQWLPDERVRDAREPYSPPAR